MTRTTPSIGDTIYATVVPGVEHAEKRLCVVESTGTLDNGNPMVRATFGEYQHNGITYYPASWVVHEWLAVGDTVIASDIPGYERFAGQRVTLSSISSSGREVRPYFRADDFKEFDTGDLRSFAFFGATLVTSEVKALEYEVSRLKAENERLRERLTEQQTRYRDDMRHIDTTMRAVKEEQRWCDEGTNDVIDRLNEGLTGGWEFEKYETEYEFWVNVTGTLTKRMSVTVSATSEDEAREMLEQDPDSYLGSDADSILTDAARHISFDDVEVEVD